jgi:hypothetical protein
MAEAAAWWAGFAGAMQLRKLETISNGAHLVVVIPGRASSARTWNPEQCADWIPGSLAKGSRPE